MDTTSQTGPSVPKTDAGGTRGFAEAIAQAMPVVVMHQLRGLGPRQRHHALGDDFTLGYLFGLLYGLAKHVPQGGRESFLHAVCERSFSSVFGINGSTLLDRVLSGLAAINPRMLGGSRAGAVDARSWMSADLRTLSLEAEFSMTPEHSAGHVESDVTLAITAACTPGNH